MIKLSQVMFIIPGSLLYGVFFSLDHLRWSWLFYAVVTGLVVAWVHRHYWPMPKRWLQILSENIMLAIILSIGLFIKDIQQAFPAHIQWGSVLPEALLLFFCFLGVMACWCYLQYRLEKFFIRK